MNYKRVYFSIIRNRQVNVLDKNNPEIYSEVHHIIPRSLGGSDEESNLVRLTAREHYLCHLLLLKIFQQRAKIEALRNKDLKLNALRKMAHAFTFMNIGNEQQSRFNSRNHELFRKQANQAAKKFTLEQLKEMFEFYVKHNCKSNATAWKAFQNKFGTMTKNAFRKHLVKNGFVLMEQNRTISKKNMLIMFADYKLNQAEYAKNFTVFQNKHEFFGTRKQLVDAFNKQGLKLNLHKSTFAELLTEENLQIIIQLSEHKNSTKDNLYIPKQHNQLFNEFKALNLF